MKILKGTGIDPANGSVTEIWPATFAELEWRGLNVHSITRRNVPSGATALFLKATEVASGRVVGVKIFHKPDETGLHRNGNSTTMTAYFENERRMLASLQSCPLVPRYFYSVGVDEANGKNPIQPFHVMEFVNGQQLKTYVAETLGHNVDAKLDLFRQVLDAVEAVHNVGFLHRDLSNGNLLVDRRGQVRLIDFAESAPLEDSDTRLDDGTVLGFGNKEVTPEEQRGHRKVQTDEVRDTCTVGYTIFTSLGRKPSDTPEQWRRNLKRAGTPRTMTDVILQGMKTRDFNREQDPTVWNTVGEVKSALDRVAHQKALRKSIKSWAFGGGIAILATVFFAWVAINLYQRTSYYAGQGYLSQQRVALSEVPKEIKSDVRIQQRLQNAVELEKLARQANDESRHSEAALMLENASSEIKTASRIAHDLLRLKPQIEPLRKLLSDNERWNRDCPVINDRLIQLGETYQEIHETVETGDPELAWELIASLQPLLVELIDENQSSFEIAELISQVQRQLIGVDSQYEELTAFKNLKSRQSQAIDQYMEGNWAEARDQLLGSLAATKKFLTSHETDDQRIQRETSNSEIISAQIAANETLRKQLEEMREELTESKSDYQKALYDGLDFRRERNDHRRELVAKEEKQSSLIKQLESGKVALRDMTVHRDTLLASVERLNNQLEENGQEIRVGSLVGMISSWRKAYNQKTFQVAISGPSQHWVESELGGSFEMSIVAPSIEKHLEYIAPGEFQMGSPNSENGRENDETQHVVRLTKAFFMSATETTQADYARITGESPWQGKPHVQEDDDCPAIYVSYEDITTKYIPQLNRVERKIGFLPDGWAYRLPTEAEWEYAARAGSESAWCFGNAKSGLGEYAWFDKNSWSIGSTFAHKVWRRQANPWGLYDMHGNCWEWTCDRYQNYPGTSTTDPHVTEGESIVVRGGGVIDSARWTRSAARSKQSPSSRHYHLGFRVVCAQIDPE